ncbi:MAG: A/G-specific adenine glycosylase [Parcubacteria bacterium C7867-004]|nr:MAG: A/G-specific adenine glycosylase [Parcubacteria bacterium C7867-004]
MTPKRFRETVLAYYAKEGRQTLPWRRTKDPYRILVSEVMLQQTQVERVIPYYRAFLDRFPKIEDLASAPLSDVLTLWQGLGYNRRAKMLHEAAKMVRVDFSGKMPTTPEKLEMLPGVGPYTAGAIAAFSKNTDVIFIETNIRTAVIHHFFPGEEKVPDSEIVSILEKAYPEGKAREWYSALMDYGSMLKRSGVRVNVKSKGYAKQTKFEGSKRQARGAILKALVGSPRRGDFLIALLGPEREGQMRSQLASLTKEGLVELTNRRFRLPG